MRLSLSTLALGALCYLGVASAHNIPLRAHSRECFFEELHNGDKMTVAFQTGDMEHSGSGNLDINFWVGSPHPLPTYTHTYIYDLVTDCRYPFR